MAYTTQYNGYVKFVRGSVAAWNSIVVKDPDTLYFISDGSDTGTLYLGSKIIAGGSTGPIVSNINDLADVVIDAGISTNSLLVYDGENSRWVNKTLSEVFSLSFGDMVGATAEQAGQHGLVPAPAAGQQELFLKGDGTWADPVASSLTIGGMKADIESLQETQQTLVGNDVGSSVRAIAQSEVAKVVNGATEAFDTLLEIEQWIATHPDAEATANLITDVGHLNDTVFGVEGETPVVGLVQKVGDLETLINGDGTAENPGVLSDVTVLQVSVQALEDNFTNLSNQVNGIDEKLKWQDLVEVVEG